MKIVTKKPAIYDKLVQHFNVEWENGLIIAYRGRVHCKVQNIGPFKEVHEQVHLDQQKAMGDDKWWDLYLANPEFRALQEIEAYTAEWAYIKSHTELTTRDQRRYYMRKIIDDLSGPMYGNVITRKQAEQLFK